MIAEAGLASLWLAAGMALLQLMVALGAAGEAVATQRRPLRALAFAQGSLALLAFAALMACFARSDMSVALVATNSHSLQPMIYKLAATWGNHEGSMLLWVMVLALCGAGFALVERRLDLPMWAATLAAQAGIALGFYAFLLAASNPFARLDPAPADGQGLNPLLQDPGLAFHPPTLYLGYVGLSVAFSIAIGALVSGRVGPAMARAMRPWVLAAWIFLTLGITAGSYWAYYELGWGGWWFWDPVENASLMPWLAATALLHSLNVLAARDALRAWTVMLAVVAFSMSMVGTFLVRSGILTSVHAFAIDPRRGAFILALLALYVGGALALFAWRVGTVREGAGFDPVSREAGLVANNLLLSVILGIVLTGTLYPLVAEATTGAKISVGAPYFDAVAGPLALVIAALLMIAPQLRWRRDRAPVLRRLAPGLLTAIGMLLATLLLAPTMAVLPRLGLALGLGLIPASLMPLWGRRLWRIPLATLGMVVAHAGVGVALVGMACDSAFTEERLALARPGETLAVGPWLVEFASLTPTAGPDWTGLEAEFRASRGDGLVRLKPLVRSFFDPPTITSETAIATTWNGQLYSVVGQGDGEGRWQVRLWWKPFVTLIWLGGALAAVGGALALAGRALRRRRDARRVA